jgi:hypothetical protein
MSGRAGAEEDDSEDTSDVTGEVGSASMEGGDFVLWAEVGGCCSAEVGVGEDGRDTSDLMEAADTASTGGGGVVSSVEAEDCRGCVTVETAESIGGDLGTSDSMAAVDSASARKDDVAT